MCFAKNLFNNRRWNMFRRILWKLPTIKRGRLIPQTVPACPTITEYRSDYEFQSLRDSIGRGHSNRKGVEL